MTDATITGIIKWFNKEKGYGFIKPDAGATDVFVHITNLDDDLKAVSKLDDLPVTYQQGESRSRPYAVNVCRAESATALTKGVVVYFKWENPENPDNLFGFIAVAGLKRHVPVHVTALAGIPRKQAAQIDKGTRVLFRLEERMHKGKRSWRAFDVQLDTAAALAPSTN